MRAKRQRKAEEVKEQKEKEDTILSRYQSLMVRYPVGMNLLQGVLLTFLGSAVATQISEGRIDWSDVVVMSFVNATFITPVLIVWFRELNKVRLEHNVCTVWLIFVNILHEMPNVSLISMATRQR